MEEVGACERSAPEGWLRSRVARWVRLLGVALAVLGASSCREPTPTTPLPRIFAVPSLVAFPDTFVGKQRELEFELRNAGRSPLALTVPSLPAPFEWVAPPVEAAIGPTRVRVRFTPTGPGDVQTTVALIAEDQRVELQLTGEGLPIPTCPRAVTCHETYFDLETEQCRERPLPDDTACDPSNACVVNAVCRGGACEGEPIACDDGDACTVDVCNPLDGCGAVPAPPCPDSLETCQLGRCDPAVGCTFTQARDGTICSPDENICDGVGVCIGGSCQQRDPADGFICAEATPCRDPGVCRGNSCVQPEPWPLKEVWSFDAESLPDDGLEFDFHDFLLEPSGDLSLTGWFARPILRYDPLQPLTFAREQARRCILWNGRLVCLDYGFPQYAVVAMIDAATGAEQWRFDLVAERPDFAAQTPPGGLFLARIAVLGSDRFAVLFEGYPREAQLPTNCRLYFLVILDPGGRMIHARRVEDPFLQSCDHPHPHGFSSDVEGNLYIAFANSQGPAPLQPSTPTQLVSYTRNGALRWSRTLSARGGELAVAEGRLYEEQAQEVLDAHTGATLATGVVWGRAVVSQDTVVQAPPPLGQGIGIALSAYDTRTLAPRWVYRLPSLERFNSYELRLAEWKPRAEAPRELVALAFATSAEGTELLAVKLRDGDTAFRCAVDELMGNGPDLFEIDNGALAMVEGNQTCGRCDPPFAESRGTFHRYEARGLFVPSVPWPGTFGGPAHHGQELPVFRPPLSGSGAATR